MAPSICWLGASCEGTYRAGSDSILRTVVSPHSGCGRAMLLARGMEVDLGLKLGPLPVSADQVNQLRFYGFNIQGRTSGLRVDVVPQV